jgi:TolA-binding protein
MRYALIIITAVIISCTGSDFKKGEKFFREGKYHSAVEMYFSFIRENPKSSKVSEALFKMGDITYQYIGEARGGLLYFKELVSNYPVDMYTVMAQERIAEIYKGKLGDCRGAIAEYQKLIDWNPRSSKAPLFLYEIASCYMQIRNYPQALIEFENLMKNYPQAQNMGDVIYQIGNIHYINSRYDRAIENFENVMKDYKNSKFYVQAKFGLAGCYEEKENFDKALAIYEELLKEYPSRKVIEIRIAGVRQRKEDLNR